MRRFIHSAHNYYMLQVALLNLVAASNKGLHAQLHALHSHLLQVPAEADAVMSTTTPH